MAEEGPSTQLGAPETTEADARTEGCCLKTDNGATLLEDHIPTSG